MPLHNSPAAGFVPSLGGLFFVAWFLMARYTIARAPMEAVFFSFGSFGALFNPAPCGHGASLKFPHRSLLAELFPFWKQLNLSAAFFCIFFVDFRRTKT